jgi:hypothetical protein
VGVANPALKQPIFMEMKPSQFSLGRHPLSDAPYWNSDMVIREQGQGHHRLSGAPYWNPDMVTSERGPDRYHLSDALHRCPDVVSNEQGSSHLTRRVRGAMKLVGESIIRLGSYNVGSLIGKLRELVDTVIRRHANILCVQETKWTDKKAKEVKNTCFKLWYTRKEQSRNGVGILIDKRLKNEVVAVMRQWDMIIMIKLIFEDLVLNVISAYAPQVGLSDDVKRRFWEDLEDMVRGMSSSEKLFIGGDLNGYIGIVIGGFEMIHENFGYDEQNQEGEDILKFAIAYDLMIANTFFRKKKSHLIIFNSGQHSSQINFLPTRREERPNCMDCKVIPGECIVTQYKLLVADFCFKVCIR